MDKHTAGPWHWDSDPVKNDPISRVRYRVCAVGKTITQVYYSSYEGGLTNAEADARLIAAAPDMLEALKAVQAFIEGKPDAVEPFGMVRAAIATATREAA